jgi:dTDP-4-amino-4,6-dideoxygalactose transaminase
MIDKEATGENNSICKIYFTKSFRDGFRQVLKLEESSTKVLIPSYVGLSLVEGSGILDPIKEAMSIYDFYEVDENLDPVISSLAGKIESFGPTHVLVVNYFGFLISNREEVFRLLSSHNIVSIEDFAHLLFPIQNRMGISRYAHFEIFSLHKTIGSRFGGGAVLTSSFANVPIQETISELDLQSYVHSNLEFIKDKKLRNYMILRSRIHSLGNKAIRFFFDDDRIPIVPLNYPLKLSSLEKRHVLYNLLCEEGITPTALYHRLIPEIQHERFPISCRVSNSVLNLPIHQDIEDAEMDKLISTIERFTNLE